VVSFGSPSRRQRAAGFWQNPKSVPSFDAEIELIDRTGDWTVADVRVTGKIGTSISASRASGHGGGYVSVTVAIVPGTEGQDNKPALVEPKVSSTPEPSTTKPVVGTMEEELAKLRARFGKK